MSDPVCRRRRHLLSATMALALLPADRARAQASGFVPQALPVERIAAERLAEDGTAPPLHKPVHSSGELLPVIGLPAGTCMASDGRAHALTPENITLFMQTGGRVLHLASDCDEVLAALSATLARSTAHEKLFIAIRIDGTNAEASAATVHTRVEAVRRRLRITRIDLVCLHGLDEAAEPLSALLALKAEGRVRYVGIESARRDSAGLSQILKHGTPDFIETGYALDRREADRWLLPFALEHEIAVLAASPFGDGSVLRMARHHPLPKWSADFGCTSWNQFFLKYVVSHPAVTCVIPDEEHAASLFSGPPTGNGANATAGIAPAELLADYAAAARNPMPDAVERKQMERFVDVLHR